MEQWRVELQNRDTGEFFSFSTFSDSLEGAYEQAEHLMGNSWVIDRISRVTGGVG